MKGGVPIVGTGQIVGVSGVTSQENAQGLAA